MARRHQGWLVAVLASILYLATLSRHYSADSIIFAMKIESGDVLAALNPRHPLLEPMGWLFFQVWRMAGWGSGSLLPLQVLNALGGAIAVGLLFRIIPQTTASGRIAWLGAIGFAASGATWLLSTEAEFVTIPLAAQLLVLSQVLTATDERAGQPRYAVLLALSTTFAILSYLTSLFLVVVAVATWLARKDFPPRVCIRQSVIYVGTVLLIAVPAYLFVTVTSVGYAELVSVMTSGGAYGQLRWQNVPQGVYAFLRSLAFYVNLGMDERTTAYVARATAAERAVFVTYYFLVAAVAALPLFFAIHRRTSLWAAYRRTFSALLPWTILFAAFAFYWVPGDVSFWVPVLAAWWLLFAIGLELAESTRQSWVWSSVVVCLLLVANAAFAILPHRDLSSNRPYQVALTISANTAPEDLIVTGGSDLAAFYVVYFAKRRVFPIYDNMPSAFEALNREIATTRAAGGRVFAVGANLGTLTHYQSVPALQMGQDALVELLP